MSLGTVGLLSAGAEAKLSTYDLEAKGKEGRDQKMPWGCKKQLCARSGAHRVNKRQDPERLQVRACKTARVKLEPDVVAYICNHNTWEMRAGKSGW